jgi:hypothetical protein
MARPGPGERVATHHLLRQPELATHLPHLVLEQLAQRLDQLERQLSGLSPPTLWWVLMVADGPPFGEIDSITSG